MGVGEEPSFLIKKTNARMQAEGFSDSFSFFLIVVLRGNVDTNVSRE